MDNFWLVVAVSMAIGFFGGWLGSDLVAMVRLKLPKLPKGYKSKKD